MTRVLIIVEGRTEQSFIQDVLSPCLEKRGILARATRIGEPEHKGGNVTWERLRKDILSALKQDKHCVCSTMFDYFGLQPDFPGKDQANSLHGSQQKAEIVENAIEEKIVKEMGASFDTSRFIPYVQMYEFEGLLFSAPVQFAQSLGVPKLEKPFQKIRESFQTPEDINDGQETAPSKRILKLHQQYGKVLDGVVVAQDIGVDVLRQECPHFSAWVGKLEFLETVV